MHYHQITFNLVCAKDVCVFTLYIVYLLACMSEINWD